MKGGKESKEGRGTLYVMGVAELFRMLVASRGKDDAIYSPELRNVLWRATLPSLTTDYIRKCHEDVEKKATVSRDCGKL